MKGLSKQLVYASDYTANIKRLSEASGRTDLYSTGIAGLDSWLSGGYGSQETWEVVVLHASYGVGKSTLAMQMVSEPIKQGVKVGFIIVEDDLEYAMMKLNYILGGDGDNVHPRLTDRTVRLESKKSFHREWSLDDFADHAYNYLIDPVYGVDILVIDYLQAATETATVKYGRDENQWTAQAKLMRRLNALLDGKGDNEKLKGKVIFLINQQNKQKEMGGSIATSVMATKQLQLESVKDNPNAVSLVMEKSRLTPRAAGKFYLQRDGYKFEEIRPGTVEVNGRKVNGRPF